MAYNFSEKIRTTWQQAKSSILDGSIPAHINSNSHPIIGTGSAVYFNQDGSLSVTPDARNHIAMSPESSILIKKKVFSTLRSANDLRFMDKTEKMLLRATKALFAYKVQQIRAYESLTKFENFFEKNNSYDLTLLASFLEESSVILDAQDSLENNVVGRADGDGGVADFFGDLQSIAAASSSAESYQNIMEDIRNLLKRGSYSEDSGLTTWVVDPDSPENYSIGPGTGVIDLSIFTSFNTNVSNSTNPSNASISISYPYRIGTILEGDIDIAIEEALNGTLGLLSNLMNGGISSSTLAGGSASIDGESILSSAFELAGENIFDTSIDTDYIRERLRTFYLGKSFISASDAVHFYIRGNRTLDDYTSVQSEHGGLGAKSTFDEDYLGIDELILKAEYELYTKKAMDFNTYRQIRSKQDNSFGMIHVYAGLVTSTEESYSSGFWNLSISCTDNMSWLKWSRYQSEPSMTDPKNVLEDPLTPFEFSKDDRGNIIGSSRDLLYENKQILQSGLLSYDSGLLAGQNANEGNLIQGQYNGIGSLSGKKIIQHPSGFIYRWKTGIVTATAGFAVANPSGESRDSWMYTTGYQPTVTNTVLNNLDIPNVLSVLIVGQPYNLETFVEQAFTAHNITDKSGRLSQLDPLTGVLDAVRKQNRFYGNFHPYRTLSMSSATTEQVLNNAGNRNTINDNIETLQERKRLIRTKIRELKKSSKQANISQSAIIGSLNLEMSSIDSAIKDQIYLSSTNDNAVSSEEKIGIKISLGGSVNLPVSGDVDEDNNITRAMMMVGAQRRIEDVRLNRDRNLFIVSDQYDSADIRPFILNLNKSGWKLFDGKYVDVWQSCNEVTNYLNLEFFSNSQGHLEFRPPLWNRVPLTILKDAIKKQKLSGKSVMPEFITDLFQTRLEALYMQVHRENVKIALAALMLGRYPDRNLIPNVPEVGSKSLGFFGIEINQGSNKIDSIGNFLSGQSSDPIIQSLRLKQTTFESTKNTDTGRLFGENLNLSASFQTKGDVLSGNTDTLLGNFDPIIQEQSSVVSDLQSAVGSAEGCTSGIKPDAKFGPDALNAIRDTFKRQFGVDPAKGLISGPRFTQDDLLWTLNSTSKLDAALSTSDNIIKKLRKSISIRDSYVSMLQSNISKVEELDEIESFLQSGDTGAYGSVTGDSTGTDAIDKAKLGNVSDFLARSANALQASADILTGKVAEGTVYDHLIEDDTRNLLGYGSGKRFILRDEQIISARFYENPPDFTRIDVNGSAPLGFDQSLNRGFEGLYFWAGATDFDLWRQYGYKAKEISLPFVSDPEGQGRPYAILELAMQKLKINKASITISGNEFYQPGDTVYIPTKGLLYYITSVSHSFSYGRTFTTNLELEYGHPAGGYIPGPLDVIGQQLVSNFLEDPAIIYRSDESDDNYRVLQPDSTLVFPSGSTDPAGFLSYSDNQIRFTNMMIDIMGSVSGSKYLLIRGFAMNPDDIDGISDAKEKIAIVKYLFENPSQLQQSKPYSVGDDAINMAQNLISSTTSKFGGGSSKTTKKLTEMRLPNSLPVFPISPDKIIQQVSYFEKGESNSVGEIVCLNRVLLAAVTSDKIGALSDADSSGLFPKGGPRQGSWLDLRDEITGVNIGSSFKSNIIEVGIVSIPSNLLSNKV